MAKHRRLSDNPKSFKNDEVVEPLTEKTLPLKSSFNFKSISLSGTKYIYIIAVAALLSGIFTPITAGVELESVLFGILVIFLGLGGGILIILGINTQKYTSLKISAGLGIILISLILIYELAQDSILG
jgi:hypothetical protein